MEWDDNNICRMVAYVNNELSKGRTMVDIEKQEFNVNERVIHKRLARKGYRKMNGQYTNGFDPNNPPPLPQAIKEKISKSNTNNITNDKQEVINEISEKSTDLNNTQQQKKEKLRHRKKNNNIKSNTNSNINIELNMLNNDEIIAIKELIHNKDKLLKLLDKSAKSNTKSNTKSNIKSKVNENRSVRVDTGLYEAFRTKAKTNKDKISDLINNFMEEYISK